MSERRPFAFVTAAGHTLHGTIDLPEGPGPHPTVLDCHGFKGFMEWGFHPYLADLLADRGFTVVRFNFRSSGMLPDDELVTDERAFAERTVGEDVEDIRAILEALAEGELAAGHVDGERLALLGHSRGGGASILAAASKPWRDRLKALVTWASVGTFERISEPDKERWRKLGAMPVVNARTGQVLQLDVSVLDDGEARRADYDLETAAAELSTQLSTRWLLLHGQNDETVPVAEAHSLARANDRLELHIVENGNHTFGAQHPFVGPTPALIEVMNATQVWLRRHLAG